MEILWKKWLEIHYTTEEILWELANNSDMKPEDGDFFPQMVMILLLKATTEMC